MANNLVEIIRKTALPLAGGVVAGIAGYYVTEFICERYFAYAMAMSIGFENFVENQLKPGVSLGMATLTAGFLFINSRRR